MSDRDNPWNLTPRQCDTLDALIETGCDKRAADMLGVSVKRVSQHLINARARMRGLNRMQAILEWDRYTRGNS